MLPRRRRREAGPLRRQALPPGGRPGREDRAEAVMRRKNPEDARLIGLALRRLRWNAGLTLRQLSEASGSTPSNLSRYEQGHQMPRVDTLHRIVAGLGLTMADLYRAQEAVTCLPGGEAGEEDGTLPPDARAP